ncbi:MAG: hypothetical protein COV45_07800 [Deltaproteobacteria bacterium CG11_big_fil_rev_8_21_14_0_20_47_16]|nr:MAG: hypothetical protein COV45_07800 [Deltaproteobacteria bacterium CG11_big_fil_rev_8_21_14_0_20_47_16]
MTIKKVAVLGSGIMGRAIAGHLAGCGIPSLLLDLKTETSKQALELLAKSKPALMYDNADIRMITPGNFDDDMSKIADCDWIVEAVVERLDIKESIYSKVEKYLKPHQIISSNTSGIDLKDLTNGRSELFKKRFLITHFFNPVRYMKLLEIVAGPETDADVVKTIAAFGENVLGKGIVYAKDTPNFVANRIGVQGMMAAIHAVVNKGWGIEVVDQVMGTPTARPKSAMFRTADIVGIDTLAHVADNNVKGCPNDEDLKLFELPDYVKEMIQKKWLGDKTGQGFYKKTKTPEGKTEILVLDPKSMDYRPQQKIKTDSLGAARNIDNPAERLAAVVWGSDEASEIAWYLISSSIVYSANRIPEIANDILNVDRAMRWGFNWDLGPFEIWDALGVAKVCEKLKAEGRAIPKIVQQLLDKGLSSFYQEKAGVVSYFDQNAGAYKAIPEPKNVIILKSLVERNKTVAKNDSASVIDLGDGVFNVQFHAKMNAIDDGIIEMLNRGMDEAEKNGVGVVVANDGPNFCVGANLMLVFLECQQQNWSRIDDIAKAFQNVNQRMSYGKVPVVVAPHQMALGGGCEVILGGTHVHAAAETYMGLVEVGVGLIPAGGGCKNMLLHNEEKQLAKHNPKNDVWMAPKDGGPFPKVSAAFQTIMMAQVATSAKEAKRMGYLRKSDAISVNADQRIYDAKQDVLAMSKNFTPREMVDIQLPGVGGKMALVNALRGFVAQGLATEYDAVIGEKLAHILTGGDRPETHMATQQHILDLEREAFLSLCGMEKTQARIQNMLMKGKPLRN